VETDKKFYTTPIRAKKVKRVQNEAAGYQMVLGLRAGKGKAYRSPSFPLSNCLEKCQ
jgi:hypothetical protein